MQPTNISAAVILQSIHKCNSAIIVPLSRRFSSILVSIYTILKFNVCSSCYKFAHIDNSAAPHSCITRLYNYGYLALNLILPLKSLSNPAFDCVKHDIVKWPQPMLKGFSCWDLVLKEMSCHMVTGWKDDLVEDKPLQVLTWRTSQWRGAFFMCDQHFSVHDWNTVGVCIQNKAE